MHGRAAIETAISGNPKLILLDFRLPDMDGLEVARELRKLPQTEHVPIVGWTADWRSTRRRKFGDKRDCSTVWTAGFNESLKP